MKTFWTDKFSNQNYILDFTTWTHLSYSSSNSASAIYNSCDRCQGVATNTFLLTQVSSYCRTDKMCITTNKETWSRTNSRFLIYKTSINDFLVLGLNVLLVTDWHSIHISFQNVNFRKSSITEKQMCQEIQWFILEDQ